MSVYEHLSVPSPDHRVKINKTSIQLFPTDEVSAEARHRFQRVVRTAIEHDGQGQRIVFGPSHGASRDGLYDTLVLVLEDEDGAE
jgi:hypothetical protein